jgi:hypothetical protein
MSSCSRAATRTTSATQASARTRSCVPAQPRTGRWRGRRTELAGRCGRPADRSGLERHPPRPRPRLDSRGAGPSVQPFPVGVRCAIRRSRREAASHLSRARTPGRHHRPAPRHLPSGHAHREKRRLHVGGGIQPRVQEPLRHATGSLATRHTSEPLVSGPRAATSLCSIAKAPAPARTRLTHTARAQARPPHQPGSAAARPLRLVSGQHGRGPGRHEPAPTLPRRSPAVQHATPAVTRQQPKPATTRTDMGFPVGATIPEVLANLAQFR